jgi:hypothetical protein
LTLCSVEGRYEGEMEGDHKSGYGIFYSLNGSVYDGQWESNNPHGYGKKVISLPSTFPSADTCSLSPQEIFMRATMKRVFAMVGDFISGPVATNTQGIGKVE